MLFKHMKWPVLWALVILILCGIPGRDIPHISFLELLEFDKFVHAGIFFVLLLLTARGFALQTNNRTLSKSFRLFAFIICVAYGGALEIMQQLVFVGRSADIYDFIANSFGCVMGVILYRYAEKNILIRLIK
jgi:VanZ family protein